MKPITFFSRFSVLFILASVTATSAFSQGYKNYSRQRLVRANGVQDVSAIPEVKTFESVAYYDALGRVQQTVAAKATPNGSDIIKPIVYDAFGRQQKAYLPYVDKGANGSFRENALEDQAAFYLSGGVKIAHTSIPYAEARFEESPLGRVLESSAPGFSWRMQGGNTVLTAYTFNTAADAVRKWTINSDNSFSSSATYAANELFVTESQDENHNQAQGGYHSFVFNDKAGRTILKKEIVSPVLNYYTYYIYDDFGNLRYVVPPKAVEVLMTSGWNSNNLNGNDLVYWFQYDKKQRMVKKKVPGRSLECFVYNNRDQVVMYQDGNRLAASQWITYDYDLWGRPIRKGILYSLTATYASLQDYLDNDTGPLYESVNDEPNTDGYTDVSFPVYANYPSSSYYNYYAYDKYPTWLPTSHAFKPLTGYAEKRSNAVTGMLTATKERTLEGNGIWLTTASYYDDYGRLIETVSDNHMGKVDVVAIKYRDEDNQVEKTVTFHNYGTTSQVKIQHSFSYLDNGQLKEAYRNVNDQPAEVMTKQQVYNELGQLVQQKVHSTDGGANFLQTVDFKYNIRGWLTNINNSNLLNDNWFIQNEVNLALDETVSQLILDTLEFGISSHTDGKRTWMKLALSDAKMLQVCKENDPGDCRLVNIAESQNSEYYADEPEQLAMYNTLLASAGQTYQVALGQLVIDQYTETQDFIDQIDALLSQQLTAQGMPLDCINALMAQANAYISTRVGIVYFNNDENDLFGLDVMYDQVFTGLSSQKQYNGNISGIRWQTKGNLGQRGYGYTYDRMNRMTDARYARRTQTGWDGDLDRYSEFGIEFDANGNIKKLKRNGATAHSGGNSYTFGLMDDLTYTCNGNRLTAVEDAQGKGQPTNALPDFKDRNSTGSNEYAYDANGNLSRDDNKGITNIVYNFLNKPCLIEFGPNRKIEYFYSSTGVKLTKRVTVSNGSSSSVTRTDYVGGFIYLNNVLSSVSLDDGRLVKNASGVFESQYYLKDHLGNVRVVYGADSQGKAVELQEDHYYPYGMTMSGLSIVSSLANNYKYQGKEYQPEGFDTDGNSTLDTYLAWSDFDARFFDTQLGRWHVPDPANQYASPYVGMGNNPASRVDPDGMWAGPGDEIFQLGDITKGSHELSGVEITARRPRGIFTGTNASEEGDTGWPETVDKSTYSPTGVGSGGASAPRKNANNYSKTGPTPKTPPTQAEINKIKQKTEQNKKLLSSKQKEKDNLEKTKKAAERKKDYSIDKAVKHLNAKAGSVSTHNCSKFVQDAIEAGGLDIPGGPFAGRKYGPILTKLGFESLQIKGLDGYFPIKGDIAVFEGYPGGTADKNGIPYGHIQMYNGEKWVSDFIQNRPFWPGSKYEQANKGYQIFRWKP